MPVHADRRGRKDRENAIGQVWSSVIPRLTPSSTNRQVVPLGASTQSAGCTPGLRVQFIKTLGAVRSCPTKFAGREQENHWLLYSAWRRPPIPVSLRPRGARSSH